MGSRRLNRSCITQHMRSRGCSPPRFCRAPVAPRGGAGSTAPLPLDPTITTGRLPNGLVYFIRHNPRPGNRVLLRLAVRAGSNDEAQDQRGLAHMLEHMAFNGSAKFKPGELVKYLESIGARFGPHVKPTRATTKPSTCWTCPPIARVR